MLKIKKNYFNMFLNKKTFPSQYEMYKILSTKLTKLMSIIFFSNQSNN